VGVVVFFSLVAHLPQQQQHWQIWGIPLCAYKITKHFSSANCFLKILIILIFKLNKLPIVEEKSWVVKVGEAWGIHSPKTHYLYIWQYVLCDYGNGDERERERERDREGEREVLNWIFFCLKLKGIHNGYAKNVILFYFLVLSFANFITNLLGYYHTTPLHICALCSWIPAKLHDRHRSSLHQSFLRTKHTHTHTHTHKCFYHNNT
jgi:hypothetical protein